MLYIINYSTTFCPFESRKSRKEEEKNTKIWISRERKELFGWNIKHFSAFEGLSFGEKIKIWSKIADTSFKFQKQLFADVFQNKRFQKFGNIHVKTPVQELLSNIVAGLEDCNCVKKRFQHKSYEYCKIFRDTYFEEHLQTAASVLLIIKLLIKYWTSADLFLIKNIAWNGFY